MPNIPLDQIEFGSRFRREYGDIGQLAYSINKNGLISPLAVGLANKMSIHRETDLPYILLAGGRRYTALKHLKWDSIPVRIYDQALSELDLRSIELAENFDRKDLSYVEEVALMKEINDLQIAIHGQRFSKNPQDPGWTQGDTAKLVHKTPSTVAKDLQLADAITQFPALGLDKCKNKADAIKLLKKAAKSASNQQKAEAYTLANTSKLFTRLSSSYIIGDCFETFSKFPSNTLDLIEIDPPYAIDLQNSKRDNICPGYTEIEEDEYADFITKLTQESYRTLKESGWLIFWFGPDPWFNLVAEVIKACGFKMNLIPGIWAKPAGQTQQPESYLANSYEMFFYARKSTGVLNKPGHSNVFQYSPIPVAQKYHPTQRPLDLMVELFTTFSRPNASGYIPFLGSGVSLLAGHLCQLNLLGNDLNSTYKDGYVVELEKMLAMAPNA